MSKIDGAVPRISINSLLEGSEDEPGAQENGSKGVLAEEAFTTLEIYKRYERTYPSGSKFKPVDR